MSFVAMEKLQCQVCGTLHMHGAGILINKRLKNIDPDKTVTGLGLCEEHDTLFKKGYVALVGVNNAGNDNVISFSDAYRTGEIVHVSRNFAIKQLDMNKNDVKLPMVFCDSELIMELKKALEESEGVNHDAPPSVH